MRHILTMLVLALAAAPAAGQMRLRIPAAPADLRAVAGPSSVSLFWSDEAVDEEGYRVQRERQEGSAWVAGGGVTLPAGAEAHVDAPGPGTYRYKIRAYNKRGFSSWVGPVTVDLVPPPAPEAPTGLTARDGGSANAVLQWTDASSNETAFEIERNPALAGGLAQAGADVTSWSDPCGVGEFSYRVRAINEDGASDWTGWVDVNVTPDGWTQFTPSPDTRIVYVSSSDGNDANTGLSEQDPVRSFAVATSKLRSGYPDWMLLKRGDTWENVTFISGWSKSGRSPSEPMVIGTYGPSSERPMVLTAPTAAAVQPQGGTTTWSNLIFSGLHLEPYQRTVEQSPIGVRWISPGSHILFEDCYVAGYSTNFDFEYGESGKITNIKLRRCTVADSWSATSHSQGLFATYVDGLEVEECLFDHNGWNTDVGDPPTTFNHGIYLTTKTSNVVVRGCILSRNSATGVQARSGGIIEGNLFVDNPAGLNFGWSQGGSPQNPAGVTGRAVNNVIMGGLDRGFGGWGIAIGNIGAGGGSQVSGNVIVATSPNALAGMEVAGLNGYGIYDLQIASNTLVGWNKLIAVYGTPGVNLHGIAVHDNILQRMDTTGMLVQFRDSPWGSDVDFDGNTYFRGGSASAWLGDTTGQYSVVTWRTHADEATAQALQAQFLDPGRTPAVYNASLGGAATLEAFLSEARRQSRSFWRPQYTGDSVTDYIRAGFEASP